MCIFFNNWSQLARNRNYTDLVSGTSTGKTEMQRVQNYEEHRRHRDQ